MIKGVIFDLDGTLLDSMSIWSSIDREFITENGVKSLPPEVSEVVKKMPVAESAQYFIKLFGLDCSKEYVIRRIEELVRDRYEKTIPLKADVREILDFFDSRGIPYGIATATYKNLAEAALKRCGIYERFRFLLTDSDHPAGKNFPDIFLDGAQRLGALPEETLVVEDSLHCIQTAGAAGFVTVGVYDPAAENEKMKIAEISDLYVESLGELVKKLHSGQALPALYSEGAAE